jgi:hypothetical protein
LKLSTKAFWIGLPGAMKVSVTRGSPVPGLDLRGMLWIARSG